MSSSITNSRVPVSSSFRQVTDAFLAQSGLPFADVLPAERIEEVFAEYDNLFAASSVYSTPVVLWGFLGQVLCDGKEASCESAVARIVVHQVMAGLPAPTADTGDVLVADRYYCSFMMIALLLGRGCDVCTRQHQARHSDFRRGKRLGKCDHLVEWTRPCRPEWMDEATYASIPEKLVLREIRFQVVEPGYRPRKLTIVTTLTDAEAYTIEDVAELYGYRWHAELDIREIKSWLHLEHLRCKSPPMVRREVWTTLLAYNLVRTTATSAALLHGVEPRQISFTATCQHVLSAWMVLATSTAQSDARLSLCRALLERISQVLVGNRPGRIEPRVLKRRRHRYPLMMKPRDELRKELLQRK